MMKIGIILKTTRRMVKGGKLKEREGEGEKELNYEESRLGRGPI